MTKRNPTKRNGVVAVKAALLMVPMMGMLALAVDYGYLLKHRTDLQRTADAAALAAVRNLLPAEDGSQDFDSVRAAARQYANLNTDEASFQVLDADIEIGRYDPSSVYSGVTLLNSGIRDTVRVTVRRDSSANSNVSLFFARAIGIQDSDVAATATAVLRKGRYIPPGTGLLPVAIPQSVWLSFAVNDEMNVFTDGGITDADGNSVPGNWGTVDIGDTNNSTADISNQIESGLRQSDLDALESDGRIPTNEHIDTEWTFLAQGETGMSAGIKDAVRSLHGTSTYIPIYDQVTAQGNNAEFRIVGWGSVEVVTSNWQGNNNTYITLKKQYKYDGKLKPVMDLSDQDGSIDGAFTTPVLIE